MFKLSEKYKVLNLLASTVITADLVTTGQDLEVYEQDAMVVLSTGLISSTVATYAVNVEASTALAGTYTSIASFTTVGSASDYGVAAIPVAIGGTDRKYVRLNIDATANGGSINGIFTANIILRVSDTALVTNSPIVL